MPIVRIGPNSADDFDGIEDCWLAQDDPTANKNNTGDISIGKYATGQHAHGLLRFPGLSNIPPGVTVTEVRLYGAAEFLNLTAGHTLSARRLLRNATWSQATWTVYTTGNNWTTGGALSNGNDRSSDVRGQFVFVGDEVFQDYVYLTGTGMAQDVEDWINGDLTNFGWHIERTDAADDEEYFAFTSSDGGNPDGFLPYLYVDYEEAGAGGDMVCVISLGLAVSGNLDGNGRITGTRAMALTVAGNMDGIGRMTGTRAITFALAGAIDGVGRMIGTRPMTFSLVGDISAAGELTTTASAAFTVVGNLDGLAPMTGGASFAFAVTGDLQGAAEGVMTLTTGAVFGLVGAMDGFGRMTGARTMTFSLVGNLDGLAPMASTAALAFSVVGDLVGILPGDMLLTTGATFSLGGDLSANGRLGTVAPLSFTWSAALRGAGDLFGATFPASLAVSGELTDLPDISEMVGDMRAAFGWLADLVNSGQGTPLVVTVAQFRAKWRAVDLSSVAYLDRFYNYAKREVDIAWVRTTFADGTRLDLPPKEYARLTAAEKTGVSNAGVSVTIVDRRDGEY